MRRLAIAAALFCIGTAEKVEAAGALSLAERSGFFLGVAHYCGVDHARIDLVGKQMTAVIAGSAENAKSADAANKRFVQFFEAVTNVRSDKQVTVRCNTVSAEFSRLERHTRTIPLPPRRPPFATSGIDPARL